MIFIEGQLLTTVDSRIILSMFSIFTSGEQLKLKLAHTSQLISPTPVSVVDNLDEWSRPT